MKYILALIALTFSLTAYADILPNHDLTPGVARDVDKQTLCTTSTKLVRNVPQAEKNAVYKEYGQNGDDRSICKEGQEIDHLISLEIAGSNDIKNLWPQSFCGQWSAHVKDLYENFLHKQICTGKMTIEQAQKEISTDWIKGYKSHHELPLPIGQ
jgi:hypothetical protein